MKRILKRAMAVALTAVMLLTAAPLSGFVGLDLPNWADLFTIKADAATYRGYCGANLTWSFDTDTGVLTISGTGAMYNWHYSDDVPWDSYRSSVKIVVIGDSVTSIGEYAFYGCTGLTSVTIPDSVTSIGDKAFDGCKSLGSVTIPDSVTRIGKSAFYGCTSLTSVTIPDSVTSIGGYAFANCIRLTSITIPDSVTSIGSSAFYNTGIYNASKRENNVLYIGNHLIKAANGIIGDCLVKSGTKTIADEAFWDCSILTSVTIPDSVTRIGKSAFYGCTRLTSVTIGNSVMSIGNSAFSSCTSLTSVTIPDSVKSIGDGAFYNTGIYNNASNWENDVLYIGNHLIEAKESIAGDYLVKSGTKTIADDAFYDCTRLTSVTIPDSVTRIGGYAFEDCTSLTSVTIGDSVTSIGYYAFRGCTSLTSVTIGDSVTSIGGYAFYCTHLTSVTIPDSVTSIGDSAFSYCAGLTSVTIGDSVKSIGNWAFSHCTSLTSVTIGNSVTSIGERAFYDCTSLTSVTIPDSVTNIGKWAFGYCTSLTSVTIGDSVTHIGAYAFYKCTSLTSVTIGDSVTSIGSYAFWYCTSLTSVTIGDSVTSIGDEAFWYCTSLTSVTIGDSVTSIGKSAFYGCTSLTSVTIPDSVTRIGDGAFYKCTSLTSVTIGDSVTSIGNSAFRYCTSLTSVTIPNGVTSIGEHAFANCPSLYVHIPDSVTTIGSSILYHSSAYICSDTAESYAKEYAEANGIEFRVCEGHHNYVSSVTAPTCTEQGYTTHTCTTCGDTYTDSVVDALGHAYDSTVTKEATCTEKGKMTYTCSRCGDSYTEDIAEIPHTEKTVRIEPTCTADGKHYTACSVCGATLGTVTVLPMIDHAFGEWVTVTEPTLEAEGLQECACTYGCGTKETQVLPKIPSKTAEDEDSGVMLTYPDAAYEGDVELKVSQVFDGTAFNLVALNSDKNVVYDITTMKDGVAVQPSSTVIVRIPVPVGFDPAKCVVYHVSTETGKLERMPARYENGYMVFETTHFSYYAIAIEKTPQAVVAIRNFAENRTIDYRTTLTFNATVEYGVDGAEIHWFVDGKDMGTGDTYTMKEAKKNFIVQAKYMKDGKVLAESETETVTVKTGFFDKLKAFFRALFRKLPVVVQEYLGVEIIDRVLP